MILRTGPAEQGVLTLRNPAQRDDAADRIRRPLIVMASNGSGNPSGAEGVCIFVQSLNVSVWRVMTTFDRITLDPEIIGGKACIRGMRITVSLVLNPIANGTSTAEILSAYPDLEAEDLRQTQRSRPYQERMASSESRTTRRSSGLATSALSFSLGTRQTYPRHTDPSGRAIRSGFDSRWSLRCPASGDQPFPKTGTRWHYVTYPRNHAL